MKHSSPQLTLLTLAGIAWLVILGCRVSNELAQADASPTRTLPRATVRPTFTAAPLTLPPTNVLPPTAPLPATPTSRPAPRPASTRIPTPVKSPTPAPPPPTQDPYAAYYYRPIVKGCVTAANTRIEGTVFDHGVPQNEIRVRVSSSEDGPPAIDDSFTGRDPRDVKHIDASLTGKYQLGLYEGQQKGGTWFVFILNPDDELLTPKVQVQTTEGPGCNTATIDFAHQ